MLFDCASGHIVPEVYDFVAICLSKMTKLAEEREERGSEYKERCSAINVDENLGKKEAFCRHCGTRDVNRIDNVLCSSADEKFAIEH